MSPAQKAMIENNLGVIRKVVLRFVHHWAAVDDSWQFAVACHAVCVAVANNKWSPERGKFSTFVSTVAYNAIVSEWQRQQRQVNPETLEEDVVEDPYPDYRLTLDVPYDEVFQNGFTEDLKRDVEMFRRSVEGESVTDIVKDYGISRQSYYNRIKAVKQALALHVIPING